MLLRYRPGVAGETAHTVHLAPLPRGSANMITALCGALLNPDRVETATLGHGMPCTQCILDHAATSGTPSPLLGGLPTAPAPLSKDGVGTTPLSAVTRYRAWGWPVTLHGNQVRLDLSGDTVALIIPLPLAGQVTATLRQRRCPPAVLAHPYAREHHVLLATERYGVSLPWPTAVHQITGTLLLPPTITPRGPITWTHPPRPDTLRHCREIDLITAIRAVLRTPPLVIGSVDS